MALGALGATHGRKTTFNEKHVFGRNQRPARNQRLREKIQGQLLEQLQAMISGGFGGGGGAGLIGQLGVGGGGGGSGLNTDAGASGFEDIRRNAERQAAESGQNLASRGLSGTTIGQGNLNQIQANEQLNRSKLHESILQRNQSNQGSQQSLIMQLLGQNF